MKLRTAFMLITCLSLASFLPCQASEQPLGPQLEPVTPHVGTAVAPTSPLSRREVLGLAVHFGDRNLGEIAEALVDYLE